MGVVVSFFGVLFILVGLAAFVVAIIALVKGQLGWARLATRKAATGALLAGLVVMSIGTAMSPHEDKAVTAPDEAGAAKLSPTAQASADNSKSTSPSPSTVTTAASPSASTSVTAAADPAAPTGEVAQALQSAAPSSALAAVAALSVKGRAPTTGYSREQFGQAWYDYDRNGCDTRNDILRRDLANRVIKYGTQGCKVLEGDATPDAYTGSSIHFVYGGASEIDIDHVVALSNAWQTGAQQWDSDMRLRFANDPLNLLAVSASANRQKGDGDTATWLPSNKGYRCTYVAGQVTVKQTYQLWVTAAERDAMVRVLQGCPDQQLVTAAAVPLDTSSKTAGSPAPQPVVTTAAPAAPAPAPTKTSAAPAPPPTSSSSVTTYSNCAAMHADYPHGVGRPGATDHTSGTPVTNFTVNADLYNANTGRDRDKDGIACEAR